MALQRVALVTGSNKGIGYAIVKGLMEKMPGIVYLTSRDVDRGVAAIAKLKRLGLNPQFHQLDVTEPNSIVKLKEHLLKKHGGLDLLINNAGVAFHFYDNVPESFVEQVERIIQVNYYATMNVCDQLFPILRPKARVVNISSSSGHLSRIPSEKLRKLFNNPQLTVAQLNELMQRFLQDSKVGRIDSEGWGSPYIVSKVGLTALTFIQQRQFDSETPSRNITVNAVHPGFVDTDLTNHQGYWTIDEGAKAPLFVALEEHNFKGQYIWSDGKVVPWDAPRTPAQY